MYSVTNSETVRSIISIKSVLDCYNLKHYVILVNNKERNTEYETTCTIPCESHAGWWISELVQYPLQNLTTKFDLNLIFWYDEVEKNGYIELAKEDEQTIIKLCTVVNNVVSKVCLQMEKGFRETLNTIKKKW